MTHTELCFVAAKWLRKNGLIKWNKPKYVIVELLVYGIPCVPDVFGFGCDLTQQIEVKLSRADFLADKLKHHRINRLLDVGMLRSYLCPAGIIKPDELPQSWGLLYYNPDGSIEVVVYPNPQSSCSKFEMGIIYSVMRRINVKPQIFNFKK